MSKADEMLKKVLPLCESALIKEQFVCNQIFFMEVIEETVNYLNRSEKIFVGSDWVCDVDCYGILNGMSPLIIDNGMEVVITSEDKNTYVQIEIDYCETISSFQVPYNQFLACFSPKEDV